MLEHIRMGQLYWFCNACGFGMPIRSFSEKPSPVRTGTGGMAAQPVGQKVA
ncbi:MAG: hypothetical protein HLUCCO16_16970 [Phormidium sp. OSCR]|nr:MAG: hypothetical protein HLUCCO16_16970 [Phormidium sp. OSCR]